MRTWKNNVKEKVCGLSVPAMAFFLGVTRERVCMLSPTLFGFCILLLEILVLTVFCFMLEK